MTFLSRLILNPVSRAVQRDLADCQHMHRTMLSAFPQAQADARAAYQVLYRVEPQRLDGIPVLVQSGVQPVWSRLGTDYLAPDVDDNPGCRSLDAAFARIQTSTVLRFRLLANPTKRLLPEIQEGSERRRGKRVDLRTEVDQLAWLLRKEESCGFSLWRLDVDGDFWTGGEASAPGYTPQTWSPSVRISPGIRITGRGTQAGKMTFGSALFEGYLQVTDAVKLRRALVRGIGSGKAYGFGLLSVAGM